MQTKSLLLYFETRSQIVQNDNEKMENDTVKPVKADSDSSHTMYNYSESDSTDEDSRITDWAKEPTIEDLKGDLEYARLENRDQKANVEGWMALRNATGAESGKKTKSVATMNSREQSPFVFKIIQTNYSIVTH